MVAGSTSTTGAGRQAPRPRHPATADAVVAGDRTSNNRRGDDELGGARACNLPDVELCGVEVSDSASIIDVDSVMLHPGTAN